MKKKWILKSCFAVTLLVSATFCLAQVESQVSTSSAPASVAAPAATPANQPQFGTRDSRYKIEPGDSFDITFDLSPEFNQTGVSVQPDGFVTLHGVGDVKVQGQSVPELTQTLRKVYGKILNDPAISVVLKDFQRPYFIADGQVARPGKYELRGDTTLTEAIAMAGGFTEYAKHSQVVLYRRVDATWTSAQLINVKKMENDRSLREDPFLHPGDMLFVPKNRISKIKPFIPNTGMGAYAPIP
ncbi:MAG TPA: polysaccharide biosynthesis/export family protein [Terriglobales bacterium]|jgi:polysaccharide export outer membrane protein|nr:polysaccharide biosynthesis/export family protein [Terriglobales bacterium]